MAQELSGPRPDRFARIAALKLAVTKQLWDKDVVSFGTCIRIYSILIAVKSMRPRASCLQVMTYLVYVLPKSARTG